MSRFEEISDIFDVLCPMHVCLDATGRVIHAGPTLEKLRPDTNLVGRRFLEVFELYRPRSLNGMSDLLRVQGQKLHMRFRDAPATMLKGLLMPSTEQGTAIVNLSFGISIMDGVRDYTLSSADFAATDLAIEMLYLVEAKSAAMEASRKLNLRLQGAMIAAEEQAFTDTLTGLKNRRAVDYVLPRLIDTCQVFSVMQIDLDFFKAVNDTLGHAAGDHVLQHVARILVEETRAEDTVARVGGDEFVLIFGELDDRGKLGDIATRIVERLTQPIPFQGETCRIAASIGISVCQSARCPDPNQVLADADAALYTSKRQGRARHTFFDENMSEPGLAPPPLDASDREAVRRM